MCVRTTNRSTRWYLFNTSARLNYGTLAQIRLQIALYVFFVKGSQFKVPELALQVISIIYLLWRVAMTRHGNQRATNISEYYLLYSLRSPMLYI